MYQQAVISVCFPTSFIEKSLKLCVNTLSKWPISWKQTHTLHAPHKLTPVPQDCAVLNQTAHWFQNSSVKTNCWGNVWWKKGKCCHTNNNKDIAMIWRKSDIIYICLCVDRVLRELDKWNKKISSGTIRRPSCDDISAHLPPLLSGLQPHLEFLQGHFPPRWGGQWLRLAFVPGMIRILQDHLKRLAWKSLVQALHLQVWHSQNTVHTPIIKTS